MEEKVMLRRQAIALSLALAVSIPALHQAGEWARDQLTRWDLANAALEQASAILASFAYHAAMRDAMLPRKPLPKPHTDAK
jgi:hypothetical protein